MNWRSQWKALLAIAAIFVAFYFLPVDSLRFRGALVEAFALAQWYAREHVLLCLVPAFFIAGAIAVFVSQGSVMKYLGANAPKALAYGVASISGSVLAVCSCTVLPLFAGIYRMGAGIGPATAFLYAGPAINVLAIILTARILGLELGVARAVGAVAFSVIIGLLMHLMFRKDESARLAAAPLPSGDQAARPLYQTGIYFAAMIAILVFANWGRPDEAVGLWATIYNLKWVITALSGLALGVILVRWFRLPWLPLSLTAVVSAIVAIAFPQQPLLSFTAAVVGLSIILGRRHDEAGDWLEQTWGFTKQILPLLLGGVLIAGLLLGRPGHEGLIPSSWIVAWVGGNSVGANLFASIVGAFMYFATLTEVPILQGLIGAGMGKGPALALLLAGPALSLPNMLVINSIMGARRTVVFVTLVVLMAAISGLAFGAFF